MSRLPAPETCAVCGEDVPPAARACPGCGADDRTGWRDPDVYDGLDLPEDDATPKPPARGAAIFWSVAAVMLLIAVVALVVSNRYLAAP